MKLENQVCSLKLAKRLKELGVKQESLWYWNRENEAIYPKLQRETFGKTVWSDTVWYSAFTVAELGEMLPYKIYGKTDFEIFLERGDCNFIVGYVEEEKSGGRLDDIVFEDKTEANARAKMLIYLLENKLLEL